MAEFFSQPAFGASDFTTSDAKRVSNQEKANMATQSNDNSSNNNVMAPVAAENGPEFHLGFERVQARVRAVPVNDLEPINREVPSTVATVLGASREIVAMRRELEGLKGFDVTQVDYVRDYALALAHLHGEHRAAGGDSDNVGELASECLEIRDRFHDDATALANRKLLDKARVAKLHGGNSYRMIAFDIVGLVGLFLEKWSTIESKTALEVPEIEGARTKAARLIEALGDREQAAPVPSELATLRQQAYTLLVRCYNDVRNAIAFVRRNEGDVDDIAPSLYAVKGRRPTTEAVVAPAPSATPEAPAAPALGVTVTTIPVGFPGSSPIKAQ
jgi:hypothetical protein